MPTDEEQRTRDRAAIQEMSPEQTRNKNLHDETLLREVETKLRALDKEHASMIAKGDRHAGRERRLSEAIRMQSDRMQRNTYLLHEYKQHLASLESESAHAGRPPRLPIEFVVF